MEPGSSLNLSNKRFRRHEKTSPTSSGSATMLPSTNTTFNPNTSTEPVNMNCQPRPGSAVLIPAQAPRKGPMREQDQYMPIANVIRIMRRVLPSHAKISDDAKETIQECVSEYISFITGEANDRCQREQRKTITAEDILWAMGKLGFDDYIEPLTLFLNRYREMESERSSLRGEPFVRRTVDFGLPPPGFGGYPPLPPGLFHMGQPVGVFDPSVVPPHAGGYYRDNGDGGGGNGGANDDDVGPSSSSPSSSSSHHQAVVGRFDHYAHFK